MNDFNCPKCSVCLREKPILLANVYFCDTCKIILRDFKYSRSLSFYINKSHYLSEFSTISNYWRLLKLSNPGENPDCIFESYSFNITNIKDMYEMSLKIINNIVFI
jgi:hypothetical protein